MDHLPLTVFRRSALASGLVSVEQILEAEALLRSAGGMIGTWSDIGDEPLAAKLVEQGRLNRWQAEQLKAGRSKFNLGPYNVIEALGQGGMGQVFKAEHSLMGRIVAIKVLPRHRSTPGAIASFTREIRAQAQFDHENLVRAYDAGHDGNVYFLVTEYVPGTDLRKLVRARGKLSMQDAATIISQAARGLGHAHARGLVHRDVKPGNLLVTPDGQTKVSDLGLASFMDIDDPDDPRAGRIVGTADYISPEHIIAPDKVAPVSDIYSLGCTLYYAVTGKVPFPGGTSRDKTRRHCQDTPLNPRRFQAELSDDFIDAIAAMMDKDPRQRIQSADEVSCRLAPWASESVTDALSVFSHAAAPRSESLRAVLPATSDTQPSLFDDIAGVHDDSGSQISQRTDSVASGRHETLPDLQRETPHETPQPTVPLTLAIAVLLPLLAAAGALITSLILKATH
ncbi:MAG TPA: serine/threonine-protein kinase [Pirellulales bacterium]|nr:serine/threonine-protein kinase [Pirellulales bacterium]